MSNSQQRTSLGLNDEDQDEKQIDLEEFDRDRTSPSTNTGTTKGHNESGRSAGLCQSPIN